MRLSVLDQSTASKGKAQDIAIRETLELARHCDALGYHPYWVSEHQRQSALRSQKAIDMTTRWRLLSKQTG